MEAFLNRGIKEIIDKYPDVEKILDEYGIGCGPCSVGICQLKDIVDIHNLPEDQELLTGHIQKEDEILFPWMDRNLSTTQVDELTAEFNEVDQKMGFSPDKYLKFIEKLERQFGHQEVNNNGKVH